MARNEQVTRQWHLLRRLESPRGATLGELVAAVPQECTRHPRTVRRDLEALEGAGFPLLSERVDGEVRWKLMEGFRHIPALGFSPTELMALTFSRGLLKPLEGTQIHGALDSALAKAASALPPPGLGYVRQLQGLFAIGLGPHKSYREHRQTVDRLTEAIGRARTVQMRYYSASRNVTTRREVDPYRLWYTAGALYLVAYCHRRREVRLFAVDRIRSLEGRATADDPEGGGDPGAGRLGPELRGRRARYQPAVPARRRPGRGPENPRARLTPDVTSLR